MIENSKSVGTINQKYVYTTGYFKDMATFCLIEDNSDNPKEFIVIAYLMITNDPIDINGNEYNQIRRIHVDTNHQRKGLVTDLYLFVNNKLKIKLISDDAFSHDGINQLKSNIKSNKFDISYYNKKTQEIIKDQPEELFIKDNDWNVLYEENNSILGNNGRLYGKGHRILTEYDCLVNRNELE